MQKLIVSMVRFTAAVTLYGLEQIQTATGSAKGGGDLSKFLDNIESALGAMTDSLLDKIDRNKKSTLESVTQMATDVIDKGISGVVDPRNVLEATGDLWQKSSDVVTEWLGKSTPTDGSKPKHAADALP